MPLRLHIENYYRSRFPSLWQLFDQLVAAGRLVSTREAKPLSAPASRDQWAHQRKLRTHSGYPNAIFKTGLKLFARVRAPETYSALAAHVETKNNATAPARLTASSACRAFGFTWRFPCP